MGVAKVANNSNDLVKGSLTRQKLQNSKVLRYVTGVFASTGANYNFFLYTIRTDPSIHYLACLRTRVTKHKLNSNDCSRTKKMKGIHKKVGSVIF